MGGLLAAQRRTRTVTLTVTPIATCEIYANSEQLMEPLQHTLEEADTYSKDLIPLVESNDTKINQLFDEVIAQKREFYDSVDARIDHIAAKYGIVM